MSIVNPQNYMKSRWPKCKALDHDWTMERYDYPQEVRDWIKENWIKVSDNNGGTYHEPEYHRERQASKQRFNERQESFEEKKESTPKSNPSEKEFGKKFAQKYKKTGLSQGMDKLNKDAINIMASQGTEAAIKHMFTDQDTGRQLSYSEMRMRYG